LIDDSIVQQWTRPSIADWKGAGYIDNLEAEVNEIEKSIMENPFNSLHFYESFTDYGIATEATWKRIQAIHGQAFQAIAPVLNLRSGQGGSWDFWVSPPPSQAMKDALAAKSLEDARLKADAEAAKTKTALHGSGNESNEEDDKRINNVANDGAINNDMNEEKKNQTKSTNEVTTAKNMNGVTNDEKKAKDDEEEERAGQTTAHELTAMQLTQLPNSKHRTCASAEDVHMPNYAPFMTRMVWPRGISSTRARNNTWYRYPPHWQADDIRATVAEPIQLSVGDRISSALNCSIEDVKVRVGQSNDKNIKSLEHLLDRQIHVTHEIGGMVFMSLESASSHLSTDIRLCMLWSPRREAFTDEGEPINQKNELCGTLLWKRLYRCNTPGIRVIDDSTSFMFLGVSNTDESDECLDLDDIIRLTDGESIGPLILPPPTDPIVAGANYRGPITGHLSQGEFVVLHCDAHSSYDGRSIGFRVGHRIDIYNVIDILQVPTPFDLKLLQRTVQPLHRIEFKLPPTTTRDIVCLSWLGYSPGGAFLVSLLPVASHHQIPLYLCRGRDGAVVRLVFIHRSLPIACLHLIYSLSVLYFVFWCITGLGQPQH
jgi:hypothetical protein